MCNAPFDWKSEFGGAWTLASAHGLFQPTISGPSISNEVQQSEFGSYSKIRNVALIEVSVEGKN